MRWAWPWARPRTPGAQDAIDEAQRRLDAVNDAEPGVSKVVRDLRRIQQSADNYAALLAAAFREHRR